MSPADLPQWTELANKMQMSSFDSWTEGEFAFTPSEDYTEKLVLSVYGDLH